MSILLAAPAIEPLSLAEAKAFLRVEHDDDDDVIGALIAGSRIHVEAQTRRALIAQTWRLAFDRWPENGVLQVLPAPLRALVAARVYRADNTAQSLDVETFGTDGVSQPGAVMVPDGVPAPLRETAGIEIDVAVGYGNDADDVPEPLRQAIRLLVAHWYENRAVTAAGTVSSLPSSVTALLAPYRVLSL